MFGADVPVAEPERLRTESARTFFSPVEKGGCARLGTPAGGSAALVAAATSSWATPPASIALAGESLPLGEQAEDEVQAGAAPGGRGRGPSFCALSTTHLGPVGEPAPSTDCAADEALLHGLLGHPHALPISAQEAPDRRAWSTKCPTRWSASSPRWSAISGRPRRGGPGRDPSGSAGPDLGDELVEGHVVNPALTRIECQGHL